MRWSEARIPPHVREALGPLRRHLKVAGPYAAVLALALGGLVWIGSNLANSYPSEAQPHGWPGPATFDGGVATVRPQLILAATLPPLLWGLSVTRRFKPGVDGPNRVASVFGADVLLLAVSVYMGTLLGRWGAAKTSN